MILIKLIFDAVRNRAGRHAGRRILRSLCLELDPISDSHHL
jgi:hypothetical protein